MRTARASRPRRSRSSGAHPALPPSYQEIIERTPTLEPAQEAALLERAALGTAAARTLAKNAVSPSLRVDLEARVKAAQYAKERLVLAYLRIVPDVVSAYTGRLPFMDLVQEGNVGLVRAAENYDPAHGTFAAFAARWVRRSVVRAIVAGQRAEATDGGPFDAETPGAEHSILRRRVRQALAHLDAVEAKVLEMRFGLVDGTTRTLDEISRRLGVTRERVQQILNEALLRLRDVVAPLPAVA
ncbi:sigma-70 family RNA polymerase sigma factor [Myceligenerans xiligouense]|uniref:RNA polymerase sigma factor (Sigma-70 family) n=1 Tax=Myceligenerans xiligouense TaxID=253184 RepID=A0A3N4YT54_9MICO|nr:sigma-70 family RNA polymerase sigma factor [Myceligenerans xiligouense]RPF21760.1 RNA polymerase sigma factor (sigma-70 family) [Myceligenerans xiligouense]